MASSSDPIEQKINETVEQGLPKGAGPVVTPQAPLPKRAPEQQRKQQQEQRQHMAYGTCSYVAIRH